MAPVYLHFLGCKLSEWQLIALEQLAVQQRQTKSEIVRRLIEETARRDLPDSTSS